MLPLKQDHFCDKILDAWNGLQAFIVEVQSINSFKNLIDDCYSTQMYVLDF